MVALKLKPLLNALYITLLGLLRGAFLRRSLQKRKLCDKTC